MFAFVLLIPFLALLLGCRRRGEGWRPSLLAAAVGWGALVAAITEGLSLFRAVAPAGMLGAWVVAGAGTCLLAARGTVPPREDPPPRLGGRERVPEAWLLLPVAGIVGALGVLGVIGAPNNYDSMAYHMSRVANWVQNASVAHYPTHILRQIYQTPWAEYAILQLQVMSGGDRYANLVQWVAMVGSVAGVSWIARQLGAGSRGQIFAAVLCVTIPMGLLQATSTQNDYVLAFWLVCFVACVLTVAGDARERAAREPLVLAGGALGLAVLTKGTAYLLAFPVVVWLSVALWRRHRWRALSMIVIVGAVAVGLNAGHYWRNVGLFGSPLGPGLGPGVPYAYANSAHSVGTTVSNALRNIALQVGAPSWRVNVRIERAVRSVHASLGLDPDDPRTTFVGERFMIPGHGWNSENVAPSPFHTILVLAAIGTVLVSRVSRRPLTVTYLLALTVSFGLFCASVVWMPWNARLHLPLLVLGCAAIGTVMEQRWGRGLTWTVIVGMLALSPAWIVASASHPLLGPVSVWRAPRSEQYLLRTPMHRDAFLEVASLAQRRRCERIGLIIGWNDVDYPLWAMLGEWASQPRIVHVNVANPSARTGRNAGFSPCLVVSVDAHRRVRVQVRE